MKEKLKNLRSNIENLIKAFVVLLLSLMLGTILLQVIMRYLPVSINFSWTEEIARFANIWVAFIGGAYLLGDHISVDALVRRLSSKAQKYLSIIADLIACCFFGIVLWGATLMSILEVGKVTPAAGISMAFFYLPLVICSMVLLVYHGIQAVKVKESKGVAKEC
jgi:TRAP-type C4-dicarboxylate transport system permease small subunit